MAKDLLAEISELSLREEAIDFKRLRSTKKSQSDDHYERQQNAEGSSPTKGVLPNQTIHELKIYESSFDETRKWKRPF